MVCMTPTITIKFYDALVNLNISKTMRGWVYGKGEKKEDKWKEECRLGERWGLNVYVMPGY